MLRSIASLLLIGIAALAGAAAADGGPTVLTDAAGAAVITYVARPPAKLRPEARPALLFGFHGSGGGADALLGGMDAALQQARLRDDYVLIGLKAKESGWTAADDAPVRAAVAWALGEFHADPRRVYGMGFSSGAFFLNRFAPANSGLFAGAVTYVGGQPGLAKDEHPATAAALYWVVGQKDGTVAAARVRPQAEAFRAAGFPCVYREMRDLGHDFGGEPTLPDAVRWMHALRNQRLAPSADEQAALAAYADADKAKKWFGDAAAWQRLIRIGGPPVAPVLLQALASDREAVRGNAALACQRIQVDEPVVRALAALLDDPSPKLREAALAALAAQAGWNRPGAEAALCAAALDSARKAPERRAAALRLSEVARIDLMGTFLAKRAIWALVALLDDEDAMLRQIALAGLQVAEGVGFGYQPEAARTQRQAAYARWTEWCTKACGARPAAEAPLAKDAAP